MKFGSLFSGIGGFDLAFERAGIECAWQCEIDKACQKLLERRFGKPIYDDVRTITRGNAEPVDLICGGFPCQDLSLAGKRKGLAGERSGLWFEFERIIGEFKPEWVVIENVPGLLSSNKGADFAVVLSGLVEHGYGVSWRVLDAQNFGLAQRRKRVFIVGSLGNGRSAEVLFEREGVFRDTPKGRKAGEGAAGKAAYSLTLANTNRNGPYHGNDIAQTLDGFGQAVSFTIRSGKEGGGKGYLGSEEMGMTLGGQPQYIAYENHPNDSRITETGEISQQLTAMMGMGGGNVPLVQTVSKKDIYPSLIASMGSKMWLGNQESMSGDYYVMESSMPHATIGVESSPTLNASHEQPILIETTNTLRSGGDGGVPSSRGENLVFAQGVRRLTPTECERLQGFPDGWTDGQSDTHRYKQLGNAVAVPVAEWIGRRIVGWDE